MYRNYSSFPFWFVENHPDGHDYLFCGENYQAQTVIQLDTGIRKEHRKEKAIAHGVGFCWSSIGPESPNKKYLVVHGCYWACPYEIRVYDISNPLDTLHPMWQTYDHEEFVAWVGDDAAVFKDTQEYRKSDGKLYSEMTSAEKDLADEEEDYDDRSIETEVIKLEYVPRIETDIREENFSIEE